MKYILDRYMAYTEISVRKPVFLEKPRVREKIDPSKVRVMLMDMHGEIGFAPHGPIGIESVAGWLKRDLPEVELAMCDTQPELAKKGRVDTDARARQLADFVYTSDTKGAETVIGLGTPIFSFDVLQSTLFKLKDILSQNPPKKQPKIILGNALATYTSPALLKSKLPFDVTLVVGEGEERFTEMVRQVAKGEALQDSLEFNPPNLQNYAQPILLLTKDIIDESGMPKAESSRGCKFGGCTFCSRCVRGGKDYRTVKEEAVIEQVRALFKEFNVTRFEFTDEEAFDDIEATKRLISVFKAAQFDKDNPLPRISFAASLRVGALNELQNAGLLDQLREIGLDKVFLGVEGGSDEYLQQMAKGQKMSEVAEAITTVKQSVWEDKTGEQKPLAMEMGFISFSWRMDMNMLRKNIEFLSQENVTPHVSSLFNLLEVRAGTIDETLLKEYAYGKQLKDGTWSKRRLDSTALSQYDPDSNFSINSSCYKDVPFLHPEVGEIYKKAETFAQADDSLYYAIKSITRAGSLPHQLHEKAKEFYLGMKNLHLRYLRDIVGIESDSHVAEERRLLITEMNQVFSDGPEILDGVRREITAFLREENERQIANGDQQGALAVCINDAGKVLLVRPRHQEYWGFPGGNILPGEDPTEALRRELKEEIGAENVSFLAGLPTVRKNGHNDVTTGPRPRLVLYHQLTKLNDKIDLDQTDNELADYLWIDPAELTKGRIQTRENVQKIGKYMSNVDSKTMSNTIYNGLVFPK